MRGVCEGRGGRARPVGTSLVTGRRSLAQTHPRLVVVRASANHVPEAVDIALEVGAVVGNGNVSRAGFVDRLRVKTGKRRT